ncbi:McbB family protein [Robertmurraya andreesenii]|uniref:McbB family protein n=1 Tax=Anoxybacillus andreesenii TaxID=1325932 RepID=A0ABT9V6B3_9BACL|nr:McbB family protein [Robertmurraya andreesenii]MDQ0156483.1 McbB family protein [Robertmurraya andreesenii]
MKKYKVKNFVYHTLPSKEVVVQNQKGVVKITNQSLIRLISDIDKNQKNFIFHEELAGYMYESTDAAINFLKQYGIIESFTESINFNVKRLQIISNNSIVEEHLMHSFNLLKNEQIIEVINNRDLKADFFENDLVIVFLNPYDKQIVEQIFNKLKNNGNCLLLMTYMYNNQFYIDNLYSPKWKNPCHKCHMGFIESQLRISDSGNLSYQALIDILYHEDNSFKVESQISTITLLNIITLIFNRLDKLVFRTNGNILFYGESLEDINSSTMFDPQNKKIYNDTSIHWELCDCYE